MSLPRSILVLSSSPGPIEPALEALAKRGVVTQCVGEIYRFVEEGLAAGRKYLRIVHGHGTGRLKAAVREALRGHPGILQVEDAPQAQGGAGATVITLRS